LKVGIFALCVLVSSICLPAGAQSPTVPTSRDAGNLPFTLTWIRGTCSNCRIARSLNDVQFVSESEAWAIGFRPPGETGEGDYSVLHTVDGAKTWTEIPEPWQHNEAPTISFSNRRDGWLRDVDIEAAEDRLLLTRDGGIHWQRLPMRDLFMRDVQYLGGGIGFGDGFDIYAKQGYLIGTKDFGWHWSKTLLPKGFSGQLMDFVDARHGFLGGCLDRQVTVIETADGGFHWKTSAINLPHPDSKTSEYCVFEPDSLEFKDAQRGWLLTSRHSFGLRESEGLAVAWTTSDGGANWSPIYRAIYSIEHEAFVGLQFVDDALGFIWKYKIVGNEMKGVLLFTTDGGRNWSQLELPNVIWACRGYGGGLECAAGGNSYWVLRIARRVDVR
jgi:photosystem II stability/assembly factor-like uncharacterized protein